MDYHFQNQGRYPQCPSYLTTDLAALTTCIRSPILLPPVKRLALGLRDFSGRRGLNQSIAAAELVLASHIGAIGEDGRLKHCRVTVRRDESFAMEPSASEHAIIQINDAGENAIVIFGGTNLGEHQTLLSKDSSKVARRLAADSKRNIMQSASDRAR